MRYFSPRDCIQYSAQIRFLDNQVCCSYFSCYNAVIHFPLIFTQIMLPWILTTMELESKPNPEFVSNKNNSFLPWCHWSFDSITIWQHKFHMTSGIHSRCSSALGFLTSSHVGSDRKWAVGNDSSQLLWAEQLGCNLGWHLRHRKAIFFLVAMLAAQTLLWQVMCTALLAPQQPWEALSAQEMDLDVSAWIIYLTENNGLVFWAGKDDTNKTPHTKIYVYLLYVLLLL